METGLHKALKLRYAATDADTEIVVDGFRIDAIATDGELIEIQHASLGALRDKTRKLLKKRSHRLRIVKPIVARKRVVTLDKRDGNVIRSRMSPKRCELIDVFEDLVHFATVFPKKRLTLELLLVETEEIRVDRNRPSRRGKRFHLIGQELAGTTESLELSTTADLLDLVNWKSLPIPFDTAELAAVIERPRWFAQKVAYTLRETGAVRLAGKRGNSLLYAPKRGRRKSAA